MVKCNKFYSKFSSFGGKF